MPHRQNYRQLIIISIALLCSTAICAGMLAMRFIYSDSASYYFMVWNLLLAWIPFCIATFMYVLHVKKRKMRITQLLLGGVWLAFFPNAPYLITDFMHLTLEHFGTQAPLWFDVLMLASFAITGLLLGFVSLYFVQFILRNLYNTTTSWISVFAILGLSSFGIYIGRFMRWNSWDVITQPEPLIYDVLDRVINPLAHPRTVIFTSLYFAFLASSYVVLYALTRLQQHD